MTQKMIMMGLVMTPNRKPPAAPGHLCNTLHSVEILDDLLSHCSNTGPKAGEPGGKGPLQGSPTGSKAAPGRW